MQLPVRLGLHPSRRLASILVASHAAALGGVFILSWPIVWRILLALFVVLSAVFELRRQKLPGAVAWLRLGTKGELECGTRDGDEEGWRARVLSSTTVWPWIVVLRYRPESGGRIGAIVILADSMENAEAFRQLRVWLRWRAEEGPPSQL
ncbi:MAG: hypothetical protein KGN39_04740 [Betaproteobacteria bacterium]|nr:hypothetical protein [Betaproteobacteria bacterium]